MTTTLREKLAALVEKLRRNAAEARERAKTDYLLADHWRSQMVLLNEIADDLAALLAAHEEPVELVGDFLDGFSSSQAERRRNATIRVHLGTGEGGGDDDV